MAGSIQFEGGPPLHGMDAGPGGLRHVAYLGVFFAVGVLTVLLKLMRVEEVYYTLPVATASLIYILALFIDRKAFIYVLFAIFPFAYSFLEFRALVVTLNPFTLSMLVLGLFCVPLLLTRRIRLRLDSGLLLLTALTASVAVSNLGSENLKQSGLMFFHSFLMPVLAYVIIKGNIQSLAEYRRLMVSMAVGTTFFAVCYTIMFLATKDRGNIMDVPPIGAATMLVPMIIYLFSFKDLAGRLRIPLFLANFTAFVCTLSRAYLITFLAAAPLRWAVRRKWGFRILLAVFAISLGLTFAAASVADRSAEARINKRAMADLDKGTDRLFNAKHLWWTLQQRGLLIADSLERVREKPAFGTGYFMREAGAVTGHNFHIEWLEFSGLAGYALYALFVLNHFYRFNRLAPRNEYVAVNLVILLCIIINGVTNGLTNGRLPLMLFIYMGLNEALGQILEAQPADAPGESPAAASAQMALPRPSQG